MTGLSFTLSITALLFTLADLQPGNAPWLDQLIARATQIPHRQSVAMTTLSFIADQISPLKRRLPYRQPQSDIHHLTLIRAYCSGRNSSRSTPGEDTSRVYSPLIGSSTSSTPLT
jgi:hypothetical protein